jgi:peptide chain release factor subunit 1
MTLLDRRVDERSPRELLKALEEVPPGGGKILSVYLDLAPERQVAQAWLLDYRDRCKLIRSQLPAEERDPFERATAQTERYLTTALRFDQPGVAIFASSVPSYFHVVPLALRPPEAMTWDARPAVETLGLILDDAERFAVALFDSRQARLFTISNGQLAEHATLYDDVPPKQHAGGWATLAQTRINRRHDEELLHHARHTAQALNRLLDQHPYDRLLLGGPAEPLAVLRQELPRPLRSRLAGTVRLELFSDEEEIRRAALAAAAECEAANEVQRIDELFEAAATARVALGVPATLAALNNGQVQVLVVAAGADLVGAVCPACGALVAGPGPCPTCGTAIAALADLDERAIQRALAAGARVEVVSGAAADRLRTVDGIGAWLRWGPAVTSG